MTRNDKAFVVPAAAGFLIAVVLGIVVRYVLTDMPDWVPYVWPTVLMLGGISGVSTISREAMSIGLSAILNAMLYGIAGWIGLQACRMARTLVLQDKLGTGPRKWAAVLAGPSDYFAPLQTSPIDLSREGSRTTMRTRHQYAGKYWVEISVPQRIPNPVKRHEAGFKLLLEFFAQGKPTLQKRVFGVTGPWWSHSANGFSLTTYTVPLDAPLKDEVELVVTVETADPDFVGEYGAATLFVGKASEK